jgi:hypothetical protein
MATRGAKKKNPKRPQPRENYGAGSPGSLAKDHQCSISSRISRTTSSKDSTSFLKTLLFVIMKLTAKPLIKLA